MSVADLCAQLVDLQRQRVFCIKSQSRCDRSTEAFIARVLGYRTDMPEDEGKAFWKKVVAFRKAVEKHKGIPNDSEFDVLDAMRPCVPIILNNVVARGVWDKHRENVEGGMRAAAKQLPVGAFVDSVKGFALLGLGVIVGEAGDLSNYATKERLWKRLGLAVIDGFRQGNPGGCREPGGPKAKAEDWIAHGFSPNRRAEIWAIADSMFRHQWRGEKEETVEASNDDGDRVKVTSIVPAHPTGKYGAVYGARKEATASREGWTLKRRENDARRVMSKALIEDLHKAWHKAAKGVEPVSLPAWELQKEAA
jgi:hypothetical protein